VPELSASKLAGQGSVKLPQEVFSEPFHQNLVYEAVRAEQLARRRGTAATKDRSEVRGGGAKPWRQKGTGRARAGSIRAPNWTGGGVAFGPSPRGYTVKVNRKARRRALRAALSVHAERGSIWVIDAASYETPSTRTAAEQIVKLDGRGRVLVLVTEDESNCALSFRNIERTNVLPARDAGVADVLGAAYLVASEAALEQLAGVASDRSEQKDAAQSSPEEGEH
jgi:large subunit ribosomal protein L4